MEPNTNPPPYVVVEAPEAMLPGDHPEKPLGLPDPPTRPRSAPPSPAPEEEDEKQTGFAWRFVGNMLVTRLGRAGVQSVSSTVKLPLYLSPWGDNNPFVAPNLRKRDIALAGVAHFGADALLGSSLTAVESVAAHGASWTTEAAADHGYDRLRGHRAHEVTRRAGLISVEVRIKHKLIGEEAEVRRFEERNTKNPLICAKGWFCPYLYCSSRILQLSRLKDFTMAEVMGPGLKADSALAPTLLSCLTQDDAPVCRLDSEEGIDGSSANFKRLAIFFMGISPYRTSATWSQAKVPGEARIRFHLLTHIPTIVVPIRPAAPVCAWSPWTLDQILSGGDGYKAESHKADILRYLDTIVDPAFIRDESKDQWRQELSDSLNVVLAGVKAIPSTLGSIVDVFQKDRGGIVMFRF